MNNSSAARDAINQARLDAIQQHSLKSGVEVRSLSPAYWYICDSSKATRLRCRAMVAGPFATRAAAFSAAEKF